MIQLPSLTLLGMRLIKIESSKFDTIASYIAMLGHFFDNFSQFFEILLNI